MVIFVVEDCLNEKCIVIWWTLVLKISTSNHNLANSEILVQYPVSDSILLCYITESPSYTLFGGFGRKKLWMDVGGKCVKTWQQVK